MGEVEEVVENYRAEKDDVESRFDVKGMCYCV